MAAHIASQLKQSAIRSMDDDQDHTQKSFLHRDFDEEKFRE